MKILEAKAEHVSGIARLFDLYRQYYECDSDIDLAKNFIGERLQNRESTIFIAEEDGAIGGFVQMYPSFCSVDAIKIYILHDLYVDASVRNSGVGAMLMKKASEHAREQGMKRIDLTTEFSNKPGQHLYEKLGYKKALEDYYTYSLNL